eukprot:scaffold66507_cov37-Prasinocladus_malaysianus.AAC.3
MSIRQCLARQDHQAGDSILMCCRLAIGVDYACRSLLAQASPGRNRCIKQFTIDVIYSRRFNARADRSCQAIVCNSSRQWQTCVCDDRGGRFVCQ